MFQYSEGIFWEHQKRFWVLTENFSDKAARPQSTFLIPQQATTWERIVCFMKKSVLRRPGYQMHDRGEERVMGMKMEVKRKPM